jgi:hypothetical protein
MRPRPVPVEVLLQRLARPLRQAGAPRHRQVREVEQQRPVAPTVEMRELVRAHDQHQRHLLAEGGAQPAQRVDGVGRPRPLDLAHVEQEARLAGDRRENHAGAVRRVRELALLPRLPGRDEANLGERQLCQRVARQLQVSGVERVEAAAEQANGQSHSAAQSRGRRKSAYSLASGEPG